MYGRPAARWLVGGLAGGLALLLVTCGSGSPGGGPASSPPAAPRAGTEAAPPGTIGQAGGAAPPTSPPARISSRHGFTSVVITILPAWAAVEGGYFAEQGLDVDLGRVGGGAPMLAALHTGELDVAYSGAPALVLGYLQGLETQIFGSISNTLESVVFVRPEIQTVEDLRGKSIGVSNLLGITDIAARLSLRRLGLQPDEDVFSRQTGGMGESFAALDAGVVAGVSLGAPASFEARRRGYRVLVDVSQLGIPFMGASVGATRRTLAERPAVAERTLRAMAQTFSRIKTDPDWAVEVLAKSTQTDDRELLRQALDYYRGIWATDLYPDPNALQGVLDIEEHPAARSTAPTEILDLRFADGLRTSGLLDRLPQ
jgi:ABC-type nitrate/sulfonate/bicarbonate transport system substrate-binding protein